MTDLELLQAYWWLIISVLGAALVFMLFVQGGQTMLYCRHDVSERQIMVNALGRKWELTFTTLVVFGGAFFASFPLFYSTSFGGAYWLWMAILVSFVLQAVSYEFRRKSGNLYGTATYDIFLAINGFFGCVLLGVAVGTLFFGGEFSVSKANIVAGGALSPVISQWAPSHGLEAIASWRCLLLGVAIFFLARTQAAMYFVNAVRGGSAFEAAMRRRVLVSGAIFAVLFVAVVVVLLTASGARAIDSHTFVEEPNIYLHNFMSMWPLALIFIIGVALVLSAIIGTAFSKAWRQGIWLSGVGTVLVVVALLLVAGYADTAYLRSATDMASSLTIANSSSSLFTLKVMSWVSILVPFVLAYIAYVWRKMNATPLTADELKDEHHQY